MTPTKSTSYSSSSINYYAALEDDSDAKTHDEAYNDAAREQANQVATEQSLHGDNSVFECPVAALAGHFIGFNIG